MVPAITQVRALGELFAIPTFLASVVVIAFSIGRRPGGERGVGEAAGFGRGRSGC